jgi:ferric enterobactin receptor
MLITSKLNATHFMKKIFQALWAFNLLVVTNVFCQNNIVLSGKLIDTLSSEPLSYAAVSLQKSSSKTFLTGQISDEKGDFKFETLAKESFIIKVEYIGYKTKYIEVSLENANSVLDLGAIKLAPSVNCSKR